MTKALSVALGPHGIRVNAVAPVTVVTDINTKRLADESVVEPALARTALGRLDALKDVAPTIGYLTQTLRGA